MVESGRGRPAAAFARALALSRALGHGLSVLRVVPDVLDLAPPPPPPTADSAGIPAFRRLLHAARSMRSSCEEMLGVELPRANLRVGIGSFVDVVAARAAAVSAVLIVVPAEERSGAEVAALSAATPVPVLLVRPPERVCRPLDISIP